MKILFAASEAVPFAKTGGLADVAGALPRELAKLGAEPTLILPAYRQTKTCGLPLERTGVDFKIKIGSKFVPGTFLKSTLPGSDVPVYLVEQDGYFDRPELYVVDGKDYRDNCERFVFFSRAVLEAVRLLDINPHILHCNDWQTGLATAYLETEYHTQPGYEQIASLFTIHNLAYQGMFWHWDMLLTGLDWKYFNWQQMEFFGNLNLMKTGLVFADQISTVSPRYAEEIQSAPLGCGLEGVLQNRRHDLTGIINGVDYREWNPATDKFLPAPFNADTWTAGKAACKAALQQEFGLPVEPQTPLVAFIGRLVEQKGVDLIASVAKEWLQSGQNAQWVLLGSGDPSYQDIFRTLAQRYPQKLSLRVEFSNELAHRIEAGADMFLMPSRYEPCGLNQLYSLKYGTPPITRSTGGLADTVINASDETLAAGTATGFTFSDYAALAFSETLRRAVAAYRQPAVWQKIVAAGMRQDWSWTNSAKQYLSLYESMLEDSAVGAA